MLRSIFTSINLDELFIQELPHLEWGTKVATQLDEWDQAPLLLATGFDPPMREVSHGAVSGVYSRFMTDQEGRVVLMPATKTLDQMILLITLVGIEIPDLNEAFLRVAGDHHATVLSERTEVLADLYGGQQVVAHNFVVVVSAVDAFIAIQAWYGPDRERTHCTKLFSWKCGVLDIDLDGHVMTGLEVGDAMAKIMENSDLATVNHVARETRDQYHQGEHRYLGLRGEFKQIILSRF